MTELASNFTTIFIDYFFFVHTNFLKLFLFKFADKEEATGYSRRLFLSYHRHNCSRKKNRKVGEPAKNVFFPGKQRVFLGSPNFFPVGFVRSFFFSSFFLATSWTTLFWNGRRFDFDLPCGTRGCGGTNPIFDLCCHGHECLFNISRVLGRGLQAWNAQLVSVFL